MPYTTTIQLEGETLTVGDVLHQLALDGPVAYWLWYHTVADITRALRRAGYRVAWTD